MLRESGWRFSLFVGKGREYRGPWSLMLGEGFCQCSSSQSLSLGGGSFVGFLRTVMVIWKAVRLQNWGGGEMATNSAETGFCLSPLFLTPGIWEGDHGDRCLATSPSHSALT